MLLHCLILFLTIVYGATAQETTEAAEPTSPTDITEVTSGIGDETTTKAPEVTCSSDKWKCNDGSKCISHNVICDGMIDCADASDEYLELCKDREDRPTMFGLVLHCSYSWGEFHDKICPQICQHEPQYCYYALMAENNEPDTCRLPSYPEHGIYSVMPLGEKVDDWSVRSDRPDFRLNYNCTHSYVLVQSEEVECRSGKLNYDNPPFCSEACELRHNSNFTYMCPINGQNKTCGDFVAINTLVFVSRSTEQNPDAESTDTPVSLVSLPMLCQTDKTYNLTTDCVDEVDKLQKEFENPTMEKMTDFETQFNSFKTNETNHAFETLVKNFHDFETTVKNTLTMMHQKAEQCDITLDLLIYDLTLQMDEKNEKKTKKPDADVAE